MAAFTSAAVTARTTSGCTITFNAAALDCTTAQLRQLQQLINRLLMDTVGTESDDTSATITISAALA